MKEVLEKCRYCNAPLKLEISETSIHTFQGHRNEFTIKHEPNLACTKCNNTFQSESYQSEKNSVSNDMEYSNYKVLVTVGLLETNNLNESPLPNSGAQDHIIYTNAKLYSEVID